MLSIKSGIFFRQLFDTVSCTYTYLIACCSTKRALLVDPVYELVDRDLQLINELGLKLTIVANTHVHADHLTGTGEIKRRHKDGSVKSFISIDSQAVADKHVKDGDIIECGQNIRLQVLATPGHTHGCLSYYSREGNFVLTGDALLIRGCGRTDFQQGNSSKLYDSVHEKLFTLPSECYVFPAHDYNGNLVSSVGEEKLYNSRLTKSKEEFIQIMKNLNLPKPKLIDIVLPRNMKCGL